MLKQRGSMMNIRTEKIIMFKKIVKIFCAILLFEIVLFFFIGLLELE